MCGDQQAAPVPVGRRWAKRSTTALVSAAMVIRHVVVCGSRRSRRASWRVTCESSQLWKSVTRSGGGHQSSSPRLQVGDPGRNGPSQVRPYACRLSTPRSCRAAQPAPQAAGNRPSGAAYDLEQQAGEELHWRWCHQPSRRTVARRPWRKLAEANGCPARLAAEAQGPAVGSDAPLLLKPAWSVVGQLGFHTVSGQGQQVAGAHVPCALVLLRGVLGTHPLQALVAGGCRRPPAARNPQRGSAGFPAIPPSAAAAIAPRHPGRCAR